MQCCRPPQHTPSAPHLLLHEQLQLSWHCCAVGSHPCYKCPPWCMASRAPLLHRCWCPSGLPGRVGGTGVPQPHVACACKLKPSSGRMPQDNAGYHGAESRASMCAESRASMCALTREEALMCVCVGVRALTQGVTETPPATEDRPVWATLFCTALSTSLAFAMGPICVSIYLLANTSWGRMGSATRGGVWGPSLLARPPCPPSVPSLLALPPCLALRS